MHMLIKQSLDLINDFFEILKDAILYILTAYLLEFFWSLALLKGFGISVYILFIPLKAFLYSGIYGALIEVMSGQEINLRFSRFIINAKRYWTKYLLIGITLSIVLQAVRAILSGYRFLSLGIIYNNFDILIMMVMGWYICRNKYKDVMTGGWQIQARPFQVFFFLTLWLISVLLFYAQVHFKYPFLGISRALLFISKYFHFGVFLYLIYAMQEWNPSIRERYDIKKRIFFVSPVDGGIFGSLLNPFHDYRSPAFTVLKALTPENYNVTIFNNVIWKNRYYRKAGLVAISCVSTNSYEAYKIAKEFKKRGSAVVMGGHHVSHMPDEALEYCDSVVMGYAEEVWGQVLKDYENGALKGMYCKVPSEVFTKEIHERILTFPVRDIKDSLELTRGCKYNCDFCSVHSFGGLGIKRSPIKFLLERVKRCKGTYKDSIILNDSNIYCDPDYAKEFFKELKMLKVKWKSFSTIDIAKDEEALRLAKESGCKYFDIGFETFAGSGEVNKRGKFAHVHNYAQYSKKIKRNGIGIRAVFIFGFYSDKLTDFLSLLYCCLSVWPRTAVVGLLVPIPGSQVYENMMSEERLIDLNWKNYHGRKLVYDHPKMSHRLVSYVYPFLRMVFLFFSEYGFYSLLLMLCLLIIFAWPRP